MLDVHPPHSPTHTWKDFFIHIATIVVGLLIAVGLEQTVEAIHHHHVREELRRALVEDGKINTDFSRQDLELAGIEKDWALKQAVTIEQAGSAAPIIVELEPSGRLYVPNTGAWLTAKANGDVRLLAEAEQEWLTDLDRVEADIFVSDFSAVGHEKTALSQLDKVLLGRPRHGRLIDLASMNQLQRSEAADAFRSVAAADHVVQSRLIVYSSYLEFLRSYPPDELRNVSDQATKQHFLDIERRTTDLHPDSAPNYSIVKEN